MLLGPFTDNLRTSGVLQGRVRWRRRFPGRCSPLAVRGGTARQGVRRRRPRREQEGAGRARGRGAVRPQPVAGETRHRAESCLDSAPRTFGPHTPLFSSVLLFLFLFSLFFFRPSARPAGRAHSRAPPRACCGPTAPHRMGQARSGAAGELPTAFRASALGRPSGRGTSAGSRAGVRGAQPRS